MAESTGALSSIFAFVLAQGWFGVVIVFLAFTVGYPLLLVFYNVFLHPLRNHPGPKLYAASLIPIYYQRLRGQGVIVITALHEQYGPVVRLAPNEVSYITEDALKEIFGHRTAGKSIFRRDKAQAGPEEAGTPGLLRAEGADHIQQKKTFSHAFSDRALKDQEHLIKRYCYMLASKLRQLSVIQQADPSSPDAKVDMVKMYNFTTFDTMGDLTFGEPLGLLRDSKYSPWVESIFGHVKSISIMHAIARWPVLSASMKYLMPPSVKKLRENHFRYCMDQVDKRMAVKTDRSDFWSLIIRAGAERDISKSQLYATMSDFMIAGTETTATLLSGLTYFLCKNPEKMARLVDEIRQFRTYDDLTLGSLQALPYLAACIEEGLRMYPPVPVGTMRLAPAEGAVICGRWVPGGTTVQFSHFAAYHSPSNFYKPETFAPERWLPDAPKKYASDNKSLLQPFGIGPKACIGKNLAYHTTRTILSSVLWNIDITLADEGNIWTDQEVHELWLKTPLYVRLKPVDR